MDHILDRQGLVSIFAGKPADNDFWVFAMNHKLVPRPPDLHVEFQHWALIYKADLMEGKIPRLRIGQQQAQEMREKESERIKIRGFTGSIVKNASHSRPWTLGPKMSSPEVVVD